MSAYGIADSTQVLPMVSTQMSQPELGEMQQRSTATTTVDRECESGSNWGKILKLTSLDLRCV